MHRLGFFLISMFLLTALSADAVGAQTIAIIVNRENATQEVSFKELVKIFKQEKRHWNGGRRIYLVLRDAGSHEREIILKKVYGMRTNMELKNFWIMKQFRGELFSFPRIFRSNEGIKVFVSQVPNAIGFIDAAFVDDRVQALRIDGKLPGEAGYVLSDSF